MLVDDYDLTDNGHGKSNQHRISDVQYGEDNGVATITKPTPATDCAKEAQAITTLAYTMSLMNRSSPRSSHDYEREFVN